ncbi:LOW QUALITY PROTEIN: hypothetical protein BC938DRAFT_476187 [Jimgerdemannia flammicorona]|uniref:Uncharacterized protein n=1 Tax=Jimgerdemannia flammicorona TaxID=994334 RepID=A0A433PJI0_9FUNG|nr:LOW QUALITY PROTEIN: hypothetical protein BC938DRAFT_476187 [Jimgerdemannia flammicorona]
MDLPNTAVTPRQQSTLIQTEMFSALPPPTTPAIPATLFFHTSNTIPLGDLSASTSTPLSSTTTPSGLSTSLALKKRKSNVPATPLNDDDDTSWKDVHRNIKHMDQLYDATFHSWLKSEDNVLVTSVYLHRIANEYDMSRVVNALKWLISDWRLESISVLVRHVTMDWNGDMDALLGTASNQLKMKNVERWGRWKAESSAEKREKEKGAKLIYWIRGRVGSEGAKILDFSDLRKAHLLRSLTYNWATQYTATLISTVLASPPYLTSPAGPKEQFLKAFTKDWDFSKLSEFFMYLQAKANVDYKLKCVMLQEAARRERETLGAKLGSRRRGANGEGVAAQSAKQNTPSSVASGAGNDVIGKDAEGCDKEDHDMTPLDTNRLAVADPAHGSSGEAQGTHSNRRHHRRTSSNDVTDIKRLRLTSPSDGEDVSGAGAVAAAAAGVGASGQSASSLLSIAQTGLSPLTPHRRATTPDPTSSADNMGTVEPSTSTSSSVLSSSVLSSSSSSSTTTLSSASASSTTNNPAIPVLSLSSAEAAPGPLSAPPTSNSTAPQRPQSTASFFHPHTRHQHYHPYNPSALYQPAHTHAHHHHRRRSSSSSSASSSASAASSPSTSTATSAHPEPAATTLVKESTHPNYPPAAAAINNQAFFAAQLEAGDDHLTPRDGVTPTMPPAPSPTSSTNVMKRRTSVGVVGGVGMQGRDVEMDG